MAPSSNKKKIIDTDNLKDKAQILNTDMSKKDWRFIRDSIEIIYEKTFQGIEPIKHTDAQNVEFVSLLKNLMDKRFKPQWHVLYGLDVGYAAKFRKGTLAMFRINKHSIVFYKSPLEEIIDEKAQEQARNWVAPKEIPKRKVEFLHEPEEGSYGYTEKTVRIKKFLQEACVHFEQADDNLKQANHVRNLLTQRFGMIWHVYIGGKFVAQCAGTRRNDFLVQVGKTKVLCYQHEQRGSENLFYQILRSLPYLLIPILSLVVLTYGSVCSETPKVKLSNIFSQETADNLEDWLCVWGPANGPLYIGIAIITSVFAKQILNKL